MDQVFGCGVTEVEDEWRTRSEYWADEKQSGRERRGRRRRSTEILILCGHGISLQVENGTLAIKNGFTHYPQQQEHFRYFRGDLDRPARIIVLDGSGHLTFDVIDWLAEQDVPLIRVNWQGQSTTVIGGSGYSANRDKVQWQREVRADNARRVEFSSDLIRRKIENAVSTLQAKMPPSAARDRAIDAGQAALDRFQNSPPTSVPELYGIEGVAAAAYFEAWQGVPLQWRCSKKHPIPDAWRTLGPRASLREGKRTKNRNATHPVNTMLNYAYAVAVAQQKITALTDGYDPTLGIMHDGQPGVPAFALDRVEPVRPLVDRAILTFALEQELHPADFVIRPDGACRINPQLARHIVHLNSEFHAPGL